MLSACGFGPIHFGILSAQAYGFANILKLQPCVARLNYYPVAGNHARATAIDTTMEESLPSTFSSQRRTTSMRSDLIFGALTHVSNRYQLCQLASKATRKLHKPNTRLQDTTNEVLDRFKDTVPMDEGVEPIVEKISLQERRAA